MKLALRRLGRSIRGLLAFCNSHSLLSNGHTLRLLSHLLMQWKWNACCKDGHSAQLVSNIRPLALTLHVPHAGAHSSFVAED